MPHVRIEYSPNISEQPDMDALCRSLLGTLIGLRCDKGEAIVPEAGTRVFAYPASHAAVGPDNEGRGFLYVNLRITPGRPQEAVAQIGSAVQGAVARHFERHPPLVTCRFTVHVDEVRPAFEGKGELRA